MVDLYRLVRPLILAMEPERAHRLTLSMLRLGLSRMAGNGGDDPVLKTRMLGLSLPNPIGLAAGFDKNAVAPDALLQLGFGFVEMGTVTPRPQAGNPRPRVFRLTKDKAVINRIGFANEGADRITKRLSGRRARSRSGIVGVNIGANKDSDDRMADYVTGLRRFAGLGDYFTVNISSPNTPGLRDLQDRSALTDLITLLSEERVRTGALRNTPLLIKIAPDLTPAERENIAQVVMNQPVDGLIIGNTTIDRPDTLTSPHKGEQGGLSGQPLKDKALDTLRHVYQLTGGTVPLIGVGGISSGADAYERIRAGASALQIYTALVFDGPRLIQRIKRDLARLLKEDGFTSVAEAIGKDT